MALLPSTAGGRTPVRRIARLEASLRRRECSSVVLSVRKYSIEPTRLLFSSLSYASSSSCSSLSSLQCGCPFHPSLVYPKWRSGTTRVLCTGEDRDSVLGSNEPAEIVLNETLGEDCTFQKVGSNYFSPLEKDEIAKRKSSPATEFDASRPFDLRWIAAWVDAVSERGMRKRRTFYSHDDWLQHRSSIRHYRHFASSFSSRVILSLIPPVGTVTAISLAVALYNSVVLSGWLPSFIPLLHASPLSFQLTAPALALLLVFRTEASYSRYDEARKTWTKVISSSKDVARQSMAWAQRPKDYEQKKLLLDYILAFPVALKVIPQNTLNNSAIAAQCSKLTIC